MATWTRFGLSLLLGSSSLVRLLAFLGALSDRQRSLGRMVGGIWENSIFAHFQVVVIWENVLPFVQCLLHYVVKWENHIWLFYHLSKFCADSGQMGEHHIIPISLARYYQH